MKLLEPIQVGKMTLKNRIMFPPLTTGYEERDGSIGQRSLSFYERLAPLPKQRRKNGRKYRHLVSYHRPMPFLL